MPSAFWIALGATALVVLAHVALFTIFIRDPKQRGKRKEEDRKR
ncbi:hypothetical protein [Haloferula sp. A504]